MAFNTTFDIPMTPSYFKLHFVNGDNYICTRLTFTTISHNDIELQDVHGDTIKLK
jgi:hypothetical protein